MVASCQLSEILAMGQQWTSMSSSCPLQHLKCTSHQYHRQQHHGRKALLWAWQDQAQQAVLVTRPCELFHCVRRVRQPPEGSTGPVGHCSDHC